MTLVDIVLFDGVDELDFIAPYNVLSSCRRLVDGHWSDRPAFIVQTVAEQRAPIRCANGLQIIPDRTLEMASEADIVIVPGGPGAQKEPLSTRLIEFLMQSHDTADAIASVCTGAYIVCRAGLAEHRQITTHHARIADLQSKYPKVKVLSGHRVLTDSRDGRLISTGGITCGIDLGLALIRRYEGKNTAAFAAKRLAWTTANVPAPL